MTVSVTRRQALSAASLLAAPALSGCTPDGASYDEIADALAAPAASATGAYPELHQQLVRYACLGANGHNTQPWRFVLSQNAIEIRPDFTRRTPVVDPDDHHLFASLGCAAENLTLAAQASGQNSAVDMLRESLVVRLTPGVANPLPRFAAIPRRQSTRLDYDGSTLSSEERTRLLAAVQDGGTVSAAVFDSPTDKARLGELITEGNRMQIEDPAFVAELRDWIRFDKTEAAAHRDGLFTSSSGNPELPGWVGRRVFPMVFTPEAENAKIIRQVESSAALIALMADQDTPTGWVAAGRAAQRLQLEATVLGLKTAYLNQPVEVLALRPELAALMGAPGRRPNLVLRVGRGPSAPRSLRRAVETVIETA